MSPDLHYPKERSAHRVKVDGFWMDSRTVTNAEFARFVAATGNDSPGTATGSSAIPRRYACTDGSGALVFHMTHGLVDKSDISSW